MAKIEADGRNKIPKNDKGELRARLSQEYSDGIVTVPLHCEIALAVHLLNQKSDESFVEPVRYIGVSKLSCLSCHTLLRALRKNGVTLITRGSHGKKYFPWMYPKLPLAVDAVNATRKNFMKRLSIPFVERYQKYDGFDYAPSKKRSRLYEEAALEARGKLR